MKSLIKLLVFLLIVTFFLTFVIQTDEESFTFSLDSDFAAYPDSLPAGYEMLTDGEMFKWRGNRWVKVPGYDGHYETDEGTSHYKTCRRAVEDAWYWRELSARVREYNFPPEKERMFVLANPELCAESK
jgi:hypothetical protein